VTEGLIFDGGPIENPAHELSMMDTLSVVTTNGCLRCPRCGKFRSNMSQFRPGECVKVRDGVVCVGPHCDLCEAKVSEETSERVEIENSRSPGWHHHHLRQGTPTE